jgi:hypothetical protein
MPAPVLQFKRGNAGVAGTVPALRPGEPAISLNNFDLFIGIDTSVENNKFFGSHRYWEREDGTDALNLKLVDKDGTNYVAIKAPNTLGGNLTYTLPGIQGALSSVLTNDGNGNLTWASGSENPVFTGIVTFSDSTNNTLGDADTGSVQINGGVGINKNVTIGESLSVATSAVIDAIQIGVTDSNTIDTTSGKLTLSSSTGLVEVTQHLDVIGDLDVTGNVYIGGTTVVLRGTDVFIENKDIVLGYTTSITPNDTTANHAGVAIASTEGTPLISFTASGINTLPDTYKQMMWFQSGTLGFSTDAFAFNYGVAIGTTTMADGVRLAVGSGITMTDTTISATTVNATTGNFVNLSGSLTGTISTAARANTVNTVQRSTNATHYLTFVTDDNASATAEVVYTDAGITYNPSTNNLTISGDLAINGGDVTTTATTFNLVNGTATSVNFGGAATALVMGAATGITTVRNKLTVGGNLEVDGNNIQASDGNTNITLTSNTLTTFAGDIRVNGNDIQASDGSTNITMTSNTLTEVKGELQVTGNIIKSSTGATVITLAANDITVAEDLTVQGNLYVNGNTTQVNTSSLTVEDRTIELGAVDGSAPTSTTTWDLGVLFNYYSSGSPKKSAVVWEHSATRFQFASTLGSDIDGTDNNTPQLTVTTFSPIEIGSLWVTDCAGTSQVISCTGTTRNLENITIDAGQF